MEVRDMGIGVGIFLLACGAILTFAVTATLSGVNIAAVGIVLMVAGALGIVLELFMFAPRRRRVVSSSVPLAQQTTVTDPDHF
jgi:hypothetical protein